MQGYSLHSKASQLLLAVLQIEVSQGGGYMCQE